MYNLNKSNLTTLEQNTKSRLIELFIRCQRGLLSYVRLQLRELQKFTAQRGIPVTIKAALNSIKALKGLLEKSNDDATFRRFFELPPELRQIVCLYYFDRLGEAHNKHQPPLTLVLRSVRKESLPVSYECSNLVIGARGDLTTIPCKLIPDINAAPLMANEHFAYTLKSRNQSCPSEW